MKRLIVHNDIAYIIMREQFVFKFAPSFDAEPDMEKVQAYMKYIGADHVLRSQTHFMFCKTIQDVEWEELPLDVAV
jgi:hypothetical protein